jgi:hypothetical protein
MMLPTVDTLLEEGTAYHRAMVTPGESYSERKWRLWVTATLLHFLLRLSMEIPRVERPMQVDDHGKKQEWLRG